MDHVLYPHSVAACPEHLTLSEVENIFQAYLNYDVTLTLVGPTEFVAEVAQMYQSLACCRQGL
jgi:hypothetical protein